MVEMQTLSEIENAIEVVSEFHVSFSKRLSKSSWTFESGILQNWTENSIFIAYLQSEVSHVDFKSMPIGRSRKNTTQHKTRRKYSIIFLGRPNMAKLRSQNLFTKLHFLPDAFRGLFKICWIPQGFKKSSLIFNSVESPLKESWELWSFQESVLRYGTIEEQFNSKMHAVRNQLHADKLLIRRAKFN